MIITNWKEMTQPRILDDAIDASELATVNALKVDYEELQQIAREQDSVRERLELLAERVTAMQTSSAPYEGDELFYHAANLVDNDISVLAASSPRRGLFGKTSVADKGTKSEASPGDDDDDDGDSDDDTSRLYPYSSSSSSVPYTPYAVPRVKVSPGLSATPDTTRTGRRATRPMTPGLLRTNGPPGFRVVSAGVSNERVLQAVRELRQLNEYLRVEERYIRKYPLDDIARVVAVLNDAEEKQRRSEEVLENMKNVLLSVSDELQPAIVQMTALLSGAVEALRDAIVARKLEMNERYGEDWQNTPRGSGPDQNSGQRDAGRVENVEFMRLELDVLTKEAEVVRQRLETFRAKNLQSTAHLMTPEEYRKDVTSWTLGELRKHNLLLPRIERYMRRRQYQQLYEDFDRPTLAGLMRVSPEVTASTTLAITMLKQQYTDGLGNAEFEHYVNDFSGDTVINTLAALAVSQMNRTERTAARKQVLQKTNEWNEVFMSSLGQIFSNMRLDGNVVRYEPERLDEERGYLANRWMDPERRTVLVQRVRQDDERMFGPRRRGPQTVVPRTFIL